MLSLMGKVLFLSPTGSQCLFCFKFQRLFSSAWFEAYILKANSKHCDFCCVFLVTQVYNTSIQVPPPLGGYISDFIWAGHYLKLI